MKFLNAAVYDPRKAGEYEAPYLLLTVDENIRETGDPVELGSSWKTILHGPFVAVDSFDPAQQVFKPVENLGAFNASGNFSKRLVEVCIISPDEEIDLAMDLLRARRLLRKFDLGWKYLLDDVAGQHGELLWRLVEDKPRCVQCGEPAYNEVYFKSTHLPLCSQHLAEHNRKIRHLRVNS